MRTQVAALALVVIAGCSMDSADRIDELFAAYDSDGMPGAAVMVIRDGEPILARNYGLASVEEGIPVQPGTNFRLASVTKQFTATAVLMLMEQGKLNLDDSIRTHFPAFPEFANEITIRHMLQHTSGLEDYEPIYGNPFPEQILDRGVVEIIGGTEGTYFEPGSEHRYSNSAYALLAVLVEDLSGQTFPEFLEDNIFRPIGMTNTVGFRRGENTVPNRSFGYTVEGRLVENTDQSAWSAVLGDGGVYSSTEDLSRWDEALYDNDLLAPETWELAWMPGLENYGFGWRIDEYKGHKRYHHSGSTSGFRNFMQQFPGLRLTVIVLTNRADPDVEPLAEEIADLYLQEPAPAAD